MATLGNYQSVTVSSITVDEGSFQMLPCNPTKVTPNATYSWGVTSSTTDPSVTPVVHLMIVSLWIPQVCTVAVLFLCMCFYL
jgi:hypothetical protein